LCFGIMDKVVRPRKRSRMGEVRCKYFDCCGGGDYTPGPTDPELWADTAKPCAKYLDKDCTGQNYTLCALIPSAQGGGYGEVTGTSYTIWGIQVKIYQDGHFNGQTYPAGDTLYRWLLVLDTGPHGVQEGGKNVMVDWYGYSFPTELMCPPLLSEEGRFQILDELTWVASMASCTPVHEDFASGVWSDCKGKYFILERKWPQGLPVKIKGGYSTPHMAALTDKNIFLMGVCVSPMSAVANRFHFVSRCEYTC